MLAHRDPPPRVSEQSADDNPSPTGARRQRSAKAALLDLEESLGDLRRLIAQTAAAVFAVEDLHEKIIWDDRSDERDEERRAEHLSCLIASTKEAAMAAVDMGEELAGELFRLRIARRGRRP